MMVTADLMKQTARYRDFLAEKASISPVLIVIQHKLYFFLISLFHVNIVSCENANRFFQLEDPDCFRFISLGHT